MIALLSLVGAGKAILYDTLDPDCFWHLRVAQQLERDGIGPIVDRISFASIQTHWTPYSWLAELGMKTIWDTAGYRGAVLVAALMSGAFVIFVALSAHELSNRQNPLAVIIATIFAIYLSLPYLSFRPVAFAIVLLSVCTWLILRDRRLEQRTGAMWCILPLTVLMANCHFFSVLVPMIVAALLIESIRQGSGRRRYALLLVLTAVGSMSTPMLPGMLRSIWNYQFNDPMLDAGVVAEFQPPWAGPLGWLSVILLCGWVGLFWRNREQVRLGEKLWAIGSLILLLRLGRFAPIFATIGAAVLAVALPRFSGLALNRKPVRIAVMCIVMIGVIRLCIAFPARHTTLETWLNRHGPDTPSYPCAAADYVVGNIPAGRIINEFSWGGYLGWRLGDSYPILLDGRTQVYPPQFWRKVYGGDVEQSRPILLGSGAQAAVLPVQRSRFRQILCESGWRSVYCDDRAEVLVPPNPPALNASLPD
jgi:hypothetical protein